MRFLCDAMLGRLARDLRLLGYDAAGSDGSEADGDLLRRAGDEDRVLASRDRDLVASARARGLPAVRVASNDPRTQLDEVVEALGLRPRPASFLTRCSACGEVLRDGPGSVAPAPEATPPLRHCPRCGRTYWEGSHAEAMRDRFRPLWGLP